MAGDGWNVLASFQEMGTFSKVLLLLGFVFVGAVLVHGGSLSDRLLPVGLTLISLSLAVHYFSESKITVADAYHSVTVFDKGEIWSGITMVVITVGLIIWAALIPFQRSAETAKTTDVSTLHKETTPAEKLAPPATEKTASREKVTGKNSTLGSGTQAAGDKSAAIGSVAQGPCSVLQAGGSNNTATGGNCGPKPLTMSDAQQNEIAKLLTSFKGQVVEIDVDRATPETDQFAKGLSRSLSLAGITNTRVDSAFIGGCLAYPGVSFMSGINRQALVKAMWNAFVEKGIVDKSDSIPGCSRTGEPDEFDIYVRPNG